jgi:hypothetical protein
MRRAILILACCAVPNAVTAQPAGGLLWTPPGGWRPEGPRPMRAATYTIPPVPGDTAPAECAVFFFGPGQGGSVQANMARWREQMLDAAGKPAPAAIARREVRGLPVTTIDASGAFTGLGGPMAAGGRAVPGYRLLGAVVEGPGGNVFVKLTGPAATVAANEQKFEELIASFRRERP